MATVIERERTDSRPVVVERDSGSGAGWAVVLIVIVALLVVGEFAWAQFYGTPAPSNGDANINVTVPGAQTPPPGAPSTDSGQTPGGQTTPGGTPAPAY